MDKNELIKIFQDWNFWNKNLDVGIIRPNYITPLSKKLTSGQVVVITGPRRSGKSFLMRQLAHQLTITAAIDKKLILIVNLEDPRFDQLTVQLLEQIYQTYQEFIQPVGRPYIFLDEIQAVPGWEKWVRAMHELDKAHLIVSGSNAHILSQEFSTVLTGRHLDQEVLPLSFHEFLQFKGISSDEIDNNAATARSLVRQYLLTGSFPKVVLEHDAEAILLTYFDDILNKDLIQRYKIRKASQIKSLAKYYFSNIASPMTFNACAKFLSLSTDTVDKFSRYFETVYLLFFLKRFSFTLKEQEKSPRKVYAIDTGLANTIGFRFSDNWGKLMENAVFLELQRQLTFESQRELYYWKSERHAEVDFVIKHGQNIEQLIQVCWNVDDHTTKARELRALYQAAKELKIRRGIVITEDYAAEEQKDNLTIQYIPLYRWLLSRKILHS